MAKALSILCKGHGVEPRGGHNFVLALLANPVLPRGSLGLVHLMPSRRPVNRQVTAHTAMCSISIGLYVHAMSPRPEDVILDRRTRTSRRGDVDYL